MKKAIKILHRHAEVLSPQAAVLPFLFFPLIAQTQTGHPEDRRSPHRNTELSSKPAPLPHLQRGLDLYDADPPSAHGTLIDLCAHVARFPAEEGVLTTGAKSTHAIARRSIALGPQGLSANTIAHEFGHILGFVDRYFMRYRDLAKCCARILTPFWLAFLPTLTRGRPCSPDKGMVRLSFPMR